MSHTTITARPWLFLPFISFLMAFLIIVFSMPVWAIDQMADQVAKPKNTTVGNDGVAVAGKNEEEFREVDTANFDYVGGKTRVGIGVDTEFDGTADVSHIFTESESTATSGDGWIGFDFGGKNKGINEGGVKLNHHWVDRDEQGRALRVNKVFGAYDRNDSKHDKVTIGYGQEVDIGFWEAYVGGGLSDKRRIGLNQNGQELFEKSYKYNVGGQVGKFLPNSNIRVRGGLDYAWDNERGVGESKPTQIAVSAGAERFFQGTPHSVSLDVEARKKKGGSDKSDTDTRANLSYRYDFGAEDAIYQGGQKYRRVRVEMPSDAASALQAQTAVAQLPTPTKQVPYQKAEKVQTCQFVKSTVELGSDTFFKYDSAKLRPSAKQRLSNVVAKVRRSGYTGNIRITGNTCDLGALTYNQKLSARRANAVRRYMIGKGFASKELVARGLGETRPKYPNKKATRHKNRRVDIEYVTQNGQCKPEYKTVYKTAYKTVPAGPAPQASVSKPGVTWKTELIPSEPTWVKRALHNNIRHNRRVDTFKTTAGSALGAGGVAADIQAVDDAAVTTVNTPLTVDVLGNDVGNGLQVVETGEAANGVVTLVNGAVVYTPTADFIGTDAFTYTVRDRDGAQAQGTVTVTVQAANAVVNVAPELQDDNVGTAVDQPITIDVLANDIDQDGDTLIITSIEQPANGTAEVVNSQILYTPNQGFTGINTIRYTVTDGNSHIASAVATVTVISNANTVLVVQDDAVTTTVNQAVTIDAIANDTAPNGGVVNITEITQPSQGAAVISNGQIVYTPTRDFTGTDTLTYTVSDGVNQVRTATITIRVIGTVNAIPVAQDDNATTTTNQTVTINVIGNDSDPDGDRLTIRSTTQPANGAVTISNNQLVYIPNQNFTGTDTLTYTITDGNDHAQTASVIVTVTAVGGDVVNGNSSPIAQDDSVATVTGQSVTINVIGNDSDPDGDTLTIQNVTQPTNGSVNVANGQLVYTPTQGFTGTDSLTYTINDGHNNQQTANVTINVNAANTTNTAPIAQNDAVTTMVNQSVTINVTSNDSDPDGDTVNVSNVTQPTNGRVSVDNGQVTYTPNQDFTGTDTLTYTINDGNNNEQTANIVVTVISNGNNNSNGGNTAPTITDDSVTTIVNQSVAVNVLANDNDPDGDRLIIIDVTQPTHGNVSISNEQIVYSPNQGYTGTDNWSYTVNDGHSNQRTASVMVTVKPASASGTNTSGSGNHQPIAQNDQQGATGSSITIDVVRNDTDADGDTLSITNVGEPRHGSANLVHGYIVYTPETEYRGSDSFSYSITDGQGTSTAVVNIRAASVSTSTH